MATETSKTATLGGKVKHRIHYDKTTNPYKRGIPDCYYSGSSRDLWSEHKYLRTIPKVVDLTKTRITTTLQQRWLVGRAQEGRNVSMVIFTPSGGGVYLPGLTWQTSYTQKEFEAMDMPMNELAELIVAFCGEVPGGPL